MLQVEALDLLDVLSKGIESPGRLILSLLPLSFFEFLMLSHPAGNPHKPGTNLSHQVALWSRAFITHLHTYTHTHT